MSWNVSVVEWFESCFSLLEVIPYSKIRLAAKIGIMTVEGTIRSHKIENLNNPLYLKLYQSAIASFIYIIISLFNLNFECFHKNTECFLWTHSYVDYDTRIFFIALHIIKQRHDFKRLKTTYCSKYFFSRIFT